MFLAKQLHLDQSRFTDNSNDTMNFSVFSFYALDVEWLIVMLEVSEAVIYVHF